MAASLSQVLQAQSIPGLMRQVLVRMLFAPWLAMQQKAQHLPTGKVAYSMCGNESSFTSYVSTITSQKLVRYQVMTILFKSQREHEQAKVRQATNRLKSTA
jgi:mannitol-specific phosphotransferase system IIBC component